MKVVYIHQYFRTPEMGGGTRSYEFAKRLAAKGHEVDMVTSGGQARGSGRWYCTRLDGVTVHWLRSREYTTKLSFWERLRAFGEFALHASRRAAGLKCDVVFATSTPLTVAIPGVLAAMRQRAPLVFEVRDLWPDAPIEMGVLRNSLVIGAARALERLAYRRSSYVIALSPGMVAGVVRSGAIPLERVAMIPNACDLEYGSISEAIKSHCSQESVLRAIFFGSMGKANGLDYVIEAATILSARGVNNVKIVLHGDGSERKRLLAECRRRGVCNVEFSGPTGKEETLRLVKSCDLSLVIFENRSVLHTCSPNKLFDSLSVGIPVVVNTPGWLEELVESNSAGWFVDPEDPSALAGLLQELAQNRVLVRSHGYRARRLAEREFSRERLFERFERVLVNAVAGAALG